MKKYLLSAICLSGVASGTLAQGGPTMGWSSWNTYGVNISDALIRSQADAMVTKGLKNVGYDHINIDDGFFGGRNTETGELIIHPTRFPNGLKPLATNSITVQLQKGRNTIRLSNATGWMPDIDYIELKPTTMPNDIGSLRATADTSTLPAFDVAGRTATSNTTIRIEKGKKVIGR